MTTTTANIGIVYGRFNLIHRGHRDLFNIIRTLGTTENIIASNNCNWDHLHNCYDETYTTMRINNVFHLVEEVLALYGDDVNIFFVVGEDRAGFGSQVERYFPQVTSVVVRRRTSSTRVRQIFAETDNIQEFTCQILSEGIADNQIWAEELYHTTRGSVR